MNDDEAKTDDAPGLSKPWLEALGDAEKAFQTYQEKCDSIDKIYANLSSMAEAKGDREFQIFWANMEIMKPSIYQRPPRPVVMPRHADTGEIPRKASEMLERALEFDVENDDLHETLLMARDDLALSSRGVVWVLDNGEALHVDRNDFRHEPCRKWKECGWVARRAYMTLEEGQERFGDIFLEAEREEVGNKREDEYQSTEKKAEVWEIWSKTEQKVVWVVEGVDTVLDEQDPLMDVKGFFPCPKPAYGTIERGTLKPVPDFVYYRDQVDEINELTARISDLSESLRLKGFYAAGTSEIGEAIEAAMRQTDNKALLVPVSNFAAMGGGSLRDSIVWLPVNEVAQVIQACIELRRQLIDDVYQITGLSDIMRGVTEAQETLGAQNLKAQYGSVRVQQKQAEMVRLALDVLRIKAEVMAETYPAQDLAIMAGMQIPTQQQAQQMALQAQQAQQPPPQVITIEQIDQLLKNQRIRPFAMEIETDSTIAPNEQAEKQQRTEFLQAVGGFINQASSVIEAQPATAPLMAELLKFGVGAFRANRDLGQAFDTFTDQIKQNAGQGEDKPDPDMVKAQTEQQKAQMEAQAKQAEMQMAVQKHQSDMRVKQAEMQLKARESQFKQAEAQAELQMERYKADLQAKLKQQDQAIKMQELGIKQDEQLMKQRQAQIEELLAAAEIQLEMEQQRPVGIG